MRFPGFAKCTNIINKNIAIFKISEYIFHYFLTYIWRTGQTHGKAIVTEFTKGRDNFAQFLRFFIQLKGIVTHTYIKFGKELVARTFGQYFMDVGKWIHSSFQDFIQLTKI